jgi:hypothetical protein
MNNTASNKPSSSKVRETNPVRAMYPAAVLVAGLLLLGCATSGVQWVDRAPANSTKGFVEFRINEDASPSLMREPTTIYITREGEKKPLGFVGSDVDFAPMGYVHRLVVAEPPGTRVYGYQYQTMGKDASVTTVTFYGLEHCNGTVSVDVSDQKTVPVTFSLGPKEVKGTGISTRLDPSQFKVEQGSPYEGAPSKPQ